MNFLNTFYIVVKNYDGDCTTKLNKYFDRGIIQSISLKMSVFARFICNCICFWVWQYSLSVSYVWAAFSTCKTQICPATAVEQIALLSYFNTQGIQLNYLILLIKATVLQKNEVNNLNGCNCLHKNIPKISFTAVIVH